MESRAQNLPRTGNRPDSAKLPLVKRGDTRIVPVEKDSTAKNSSSHLNAASGKTDQNQTESVAERAYRLWETDGKLDGKDLDYWFRAEAELNQHSRP
jgi:hypothetical protein